jgi:hypothetical protein
LSAERYELQRKVVRLELSLESALDVAKLRTDERDRLRTRCEALQLLADESQPLRDQGAKWEAAAMEARQEIDRLREVVERLQRSSK